MSGGVKCMESEFYQEKFRRNFLREVFKVFFFSNCSWSVYMAIFFLVLCKSCNGFMCLCATFDWMLRCRTCCVYCGVLLRYLVRRRQRKVQRRQRHAKMLPWTWAEKSGSLSVGWPRIHLFFGSSAIGCAVYNDGMVADVRCLVLGAWSLSFQSVCGE